MDRSTEPIRVLHVDEESDFGELAAGVLESEEGRIEVIAEPSVGDGLDRLADGDIDCIVSDYDMPDRNGIEFLETVREEHPDLPFILFTDKGSEEVASEAISAGVTDYIQKGTGTDQYAVLTNRIVNAVEHDRSRRLIERKERELERYDTVLDMVPDGVYVLDADGTILDVNRSAAEMLGFDPEDLRGEPNTRLIEEGVFEEEVAETYVDNLREVLSTDSRKTRARFDHSVTVDGQHRIVETHFRPRHYEEDFQGVVGVIRDVTERVERERELERYERIIEAMGDGIYALNADGDAMAANEQLVEMTGYDRERLFEGGVELILEAEDIEAFERAIGDLLDADDRSVETVEAELHRADGAPIPIEVNLTLLPGEGFRGTVGVVRDITERVERERELERQNERLEEFASVISHDLRNPLNVAAARLDVAREECDSDYLDDVVHALGRMETLIEDLRTLAREGRTVEETDPVALDDLIEDCWRNVETAEATLLTDADRTIGADRGRLQQLFENLIRNAIEHGGEDVTVRVGALPGGFYVEDDGPGIPEDERDRVLESGYSTSEEGTGFGLSIVREIVEAHGWDVGVTESDDGGARFEITGIDGADG